MELAEAHSNRTGKELKSEGFLESLDCEPMSALSSVVERAWTGSRISSEEAVLLHREAGLPLLATLADEIRRRKHPDGVVTYIIDRNLNPTNVCVTDCGFCAFYAKPGDAAKAWLLDRESIYAKVQETVDVGGVQILMQGGHHPELGVEWFEELLSNLKRKWPDLHLHAMSPPEIEHLSRVSKIPTLENLRAPPRGTGKPGNHWNSLCFRLPS